MKTIALFDEFNEYEIELLVNFGVKAVIYEYHQGSYTGDGQAFCRIKDGKWFIHDCGHCSCYGPTERIADSGKILYTEEEIYKLTQNYGALGKKVRKYINKRRSKKETDGQAINL